MYRPRVIPVLLLQDGGLVKTVGFDNPTYIGDPINAVKIFNDREADELVFLDIEGTISLDLVEKVGEEANMPFAIGGGIYSLVQVKELLGAGAEKVVVKTHTEIIPGVAEVFGSQSIIACIDVVGELPLDRARFVESLGAGEILLQSVGRDGKGVGYDLDLIRVVSSAVGIPVIALGGAGSLDDFSRAIGAGASAVAAGSLFVYHNGGILINYPDKEELYAL